MLQGLLDEYALSTLWSSNWFTYLGSSYGSVTLNSNGYLSYEASTTFGSSNLGGSYPNVPTIFIAGADLTAVGAGWRSMNEQGKGWQVYGRSVQEEKAA